MLHLLIYLYPVLAQIQSPSNVFIHIRVMNILVMKCLKGNSNGEWSSGTGFGNISLLMVVLLALSVVEGVVFSMFFLEELVVIYLNFTTSATSISHRIKSGILPGCREPL